MYYDQSLKVITIRDIDEMMVNLPQVVPLIIFDVFVIGSQL